MQIRYDDEKDFGTSLGWSTDLRNLSEMNFIQLYDYVMVSTCKNSSYRSKGI